MRVQSQTHKPILKRNSDHTLEDFDPAAGQDLELITVLLSKVECVEKRPNVA